jgi:ferredoxin-type protein NapH
MERESGFVVTTATRKRTPNYVWQRARAATTLATLFAIGIAASVNVELGTYSSFTLGPVRISCPLGVAQVMAASRELVPALALAGLAGLGLIVLFGRAFCGWICPGRWIFNRGAYAKKPWRARPWVQTALVGGVIALAGAVHSPVFCPICPAGVVCRGAIALGTGGSLLPTMGWLGAALGLEFG